MDFDDDDEGEELQEPLPELGPPSTTHGGGTATGLDHGGVGAAADDVKGVFAHVDLDAFYAQVERSLDTSLVGIPLGVVQYNPYGNLADLPVEANRRMDHSNGSLIAVSYEARARGVTRIMRGDEARAVCPEIALVQVAVKHKKADLTPYRLAGAKVIKILARTAPTERASIDEAYLDLTQPARALLPSFGPDLIRRVRVQTKLAGLEGEGARAAGAVDAAGDGDGEGEGEGGPATAAPVLTRDELRRGHVSQGQQQQGSSAAAADAWWDRPPALWSPGERLLLCGAAVLHDARQAVLAELGFTCSGGIAPSKLLAKLASGMNKPAQQTLVMPVMIPRLLGPLPIGRIRGLGGEFGERAARDLQATTVGDVVAVPQRRLEELYGGSTAEWLWHLVRGQDGEKVEDRTHAKSIGCSKTFYSGNNLRTFEQVRHWLAHLAGELVERLASDAELNERVPQLLTVSFQAVGVNPQTAQRAQPEGPRRPGQPWPGNQNISRSAPLAVSIEQLHEAPQAVQATIVELALGLVQRWQRQREESHPAGQGPLPPMRLAVLLLSASKFLEIGQKTRITAFFSKPAAGSEEAAAAAGSSAASSPASAKPSPFKIKLPPSSAAAAAAASFPIAKPPAPAAAPAKRKAGAGGGGIDDFLKRRKEETAGTTGEGGVARSSSATTTTTTTSSSSSSNGSLPLASEEVDPEVLAALPPDIRKEVLAAMQQQQQQQAGNGNGNGKPPPKKKGQLDSYFAKAAAGGAGGAGGGAASQKPAASAKLAAATAKPKPLDRFLVKKKK